MKVTIFTSPNRNDLEFKAQVEKELIKNGFEINDENPDICIHLGGDGTFLRSVHQYLDKLDHVRFIGLCIGTLGFYYDYAKDELPALIQDLKDENFNVSEHRLLETKIDYEDKSETIYGINEIRVENPFHTLICEVLINGEYLETYRGNGLLVSSCLGSSGYNKSLGGSLLPHNLEMLELTEVVSIQNNAYNSLGSSLILDMNSHITLKGQFTKNAVVGYDFSTSKNESPTCLDIFLSKKKVKIIRRKSYSYINSIRKSFIKNERS